MIFSKKQNVLMMLMSSIQNRLNTGPEPLVGKGRAARTALYNCLAFCLALVLSLSRDWWFMQQLQYRPGAGMWGSHLCWKEESEYLASLITCIILCQTGAEICSAVSLCDVNCQLVTGEFAVGFFFWWTHRYNLQGEADEALGRVGDPALT